MDLSMELSIGEVSKLMNLSVPTLRFYDKEGLLPNIQKNHSGIRKFKKNDIDGLRLVECLKSTGMSLKDIKIFLDWCKQGEKTLEKRLNMFNEREKVVLNQIAELKHTLELISFKQWYYQTAISTSEDTVKNMKLEDMPEKIQELYKNTH